MIDDVSEYTIDGSLKGVTPATVTLTYDPHTLLLNRAGYDELVIPLDIKEAGDYVFRQQKKNSGLIPVGVFQCGRQPKQVNFSPDNKYLYIALLDGFGFEIFDMEKFRMITSIEVGEKSRKRGFVEGLFIPGHNAYFITQMQADTIFEYSADETRVFKRAIPSGGHWPKVLAYCAQLDLLAVSNWIGNTIAIIDYTSGAVVHKLTDMNTPRGLAFTHDGKFLVVASYDGGFITKHSTTDWKETDRITKQNSSMRHVVISKDDKRCWVSDMTYGSVYDINLETMQITDTYKAFYNTNTIEVSPDEHFLFASCRGPNNSESYLLRSPENGQVVIIDLENRKVQNRIYGGNQPTGLDVSGDGKYLCFSNFKDNTFEIYRTDNLYR